MLKKVILLLLVASWCRPAAAQHSFHIDHYTSKNGLPENSIRCMIFDDSHFLWLATEDGLVRFDGRNFRVYNSTTNPDFKDDRINFLTKTLNGEIFACNNHGGIFSINNNTITTVQKNAPGDVQYRVIWGGVPSLELFQKMFDKSHSIKYNWNWGEYYLHVFPFSNKTFAVTGDDGAYFFSDTILVRFVDTKLYHPAEYLFVNGNLLFFDSSGHLFRIDPGTGKIDDCKLEGELASDKFYEQHGRLNTITDFSTNESFLVIDSRLYQIKTTADNYSYSTSFILDGLPASCQVTAVVHNAREKLFFVSTDTRGLYVCREKFFKTVSYPSPETGTNNSYYNQVVIDSNAVLTSFGRVFDINGNRPNPTPIQVYSHQAMLNDGGNIWYMDNDSIRCYHLKEKTVDAIPCDIGDEIYVFYRGIDNLWVGSRNGIATIASGTLEFHVRSTGSNKNLRVNCLYESPDKKLWAGTNDGIFTLNTLNNAFETPPEFTRLRGKIVRSIVQVGDMIGIGTYGDGFYLWKDEKLLKAPLDRSKNLVHTHTFMNDGYGSVWMSTNRGLYKTTISSLENLYKDSTAFIYYYGYGENDGIENEEFNGGCSPACVKLPDGYYSFPNMEGLVWMKPGEVPTFLPDGTIRMDEIISDGISQSLNGSLHLDCDNRANEIYFSIPFWGNAQNLWMDYKINGYSKDWMHIKGSDDGIYFANLPSGSYDLVIRTFNGFSQDQVTFFTLPIIVEKHFYQQAWFILVSIMLLPFLMWLVLRIYATAIRKRNRRLEGLVQQRTNELRISNVHLAISEKNLKQSVNVKDKLISILSHDIISPLRFIGLTAKLATRKNEKDVLKLTATLGDIQNAAGKLHDNALNILNWINYQNKRIEPRPTSVSTYALAEEIFAKVKELAGVKGHDLVNAISEDDVLKTDKQVLGIVLQNLISNAIKHTRSGIIAVSAEQENGYYKILVIDNGYGMNKDTLKRINNPSRYHLLDNGSGSNEFGGTGLGYILIQELLELLNGSFKVYSEEVMGTMVVIQLPLILVPVKSLVYEPIL